MPKIDFNFSGYIRGADIIAVRDAEGTRIDVSKMNPERVTAGLNDGSFFISLGDFLYEGRKNEVVMEDFEEAQ